jgi:hypothetical protein
MTGRRPGNSNRQTGNHHQRGNRKLHHSRGMTGQQARITRRIHLHVIRRRRIRGAAVTRIDSRPMTKGGRIRIVRGRMKIRGTIAGTIVRTHNGMIVRKIRSGKRRQFRRQTCRIGCAT